MVINKVLDGYFKGEISDRPIYFSRCRLPIESADSALSAVILTSCPASFLSGCVESGVTNGMCYKPIRTKEDKKGQDTNEDLIRHLGEMEIRRGESIINRLCYEAANLFGNSFTYARKLDIVEKDIRDIRDIVYAYKNAYEELCLSSHEQYEKLMEFFKFHGHNPIRDSCHNGSLGGALDKLTGSDEGASEYSGSLPIRKVKKPKKSLRDIFSGLFKKQ